MKKDSSRHDIKTIHVLYDEERKNKTKKAKQVKGDNHCEFEEIQIGTDHKKREIRDFMKQKKIEKKRQEKQKLEEENRQKQKKQESLQELEKKRIEEAKRHMTSKKVFFFVFCFFDYCMNPPPP